MNAGRLRLWVALAAVLALTASVASAARTTAVADTQINATSAGLESLNASGGAIMLEFAGAPSAQTYANARDRGASAASAGSASRSQADRNTAAQADVLAAMSARGIEATPLYQMQTTYNGIAVQAEPGAAAALAALPGVVAVHEIPLVTIENHSSVPLDRRADGLAGVRQRRRRQVDRRYRHRPRLRAPRLRRAWHRR